MRWWWQFQAYFGKQEPGEFYLSTLVPKLSILEFDKKLLPLCFQENYFSITYRGQIYTCRRRDVDGVHQWHLRYFKDGKVTGHYERDYFSDIVGHNQSMDLRKLTRGEAEIIQWNFNRRAL